MGKREAEQAIAQQSSAEQIERREQARKASFNAHAVADRIFMLNATPVFNTSSKETTPIDVELGYKTGKINMAQFGLKRGDPFLEIEANSINILLQSADDYREVLYSITPLRVLSMGEILVHPHQFDQLNEVLEFMAEQYQQQPSAATPQAS